MSEYDDAHEALAVVNRLVIPTTGPDPEVNGDAHHLGLVLRVLVELSRSLAIHIAEEGHGESRDDVLRLHLDSFNAALTVYEAGGQPIQTR